MTLNTYKFGILSELIAIIFLKLKGYKILFWRYKTYGGEIDIIAKKRSLIAIVEVKSRRYNFSEIGDVIGSRQIKRMKKAADIFLSKNQRFYDYDIRFDLIIMKNLFKLHHFKNFS